MGPFELMDLVGIDTGLEVARSFAELSFGEPRWRPNPIQARMVAAGRLGRKSGRGYYDYSRGPYRPEDPPAPDGGEDFSRLAADAGLVELCGEHYREERYPPAPLLTRAVARGVGLAEVAA